MSLLDEDDDWIEGVRSRLYPRLHPVLAGLGPFYAVGHVGPDQHVGDFPIGEELFEEILVDLGFVRNPIACFKRDDHGHASEGSWVLIEERDEYDLLDAGRQLHVTLFDHTGDNENGGLGVYAHNEYDWRDYPWKHLRADDFRPVEGRVQMERLLDRQTYLNSLG